MLQIENLCIRHVGPIDLVLNDSECIAVSGVSGSGKTLFLRAVSDLESHSGTMIWQKNKCHQMRASQWRAIVGYLPAESAWWFATIGEHFQMYQSKNSTERSHSLLQWFYHVGFQEDVFLWPIERCSKGELQRIALLRLLARKPRVLLLDEPTSSLDHENVLRVESLIKECQSTFNVSVIWVSHDSRQIERVSQRHFMLHDGKFSESKAR